MLNSVFLEVNGILYKGFTSINYYKNIEDLSGSFSFIASTEKEEYTPFKGQEVCRIIINNKPIITGYIESITYSYDNTSHIVSVSGRDKTCDIIDNSVVGNIDFKAPITLETIIKNVLSEANLLDRSQTLDFGFETDFFNVSSRIKVINNAGELTPFESSELSNEESAILASLGFEENESVASDIGENMFEYIEKYARKRDVLLTSNGNGDLVITRAAQETLNGILINEINNNNNNVKNGSINYDFSNRYYKYICKSQGNASAVGLIDNDEGFGLADLSGTKGEAIDDEIRDSRFLEFNNETSAPNSSNEIRARWEANIRRSRSVIYTCETNHLFVDKENKILYEPNKLISVKDDFCNINAEMLIRSVTYDLSNDGGTSIILELVPKDSYTPLPSKNKKDSKYNKIGESVNE